MDPIKGPPDGIWRWTEDPVARGPMDPTPAVHLTILKNVTSILTTSFKVSKGRPSGRH